MQSLPAQSLAALEDVVCRVDVLLGSGAITVRECLRLRPQMVMPLEQAVGADMQVLVNGVLVALGEAVIVEDSTAIRVTEIVPPPSAEAPA